MARPLRLEFAGALYHVTARGDGREDIYRAEGTRRLFLDVLGGVYRRFHWVVHAYCLMTNHYHLLVETPDANLSKGMRELNGVYTQRFNRTYDRAGHVFQGRYKAILVQKEAYLLELARYVVRNPVRARMVRAPGEWPWSSYRAMIGEVVALEVQALFDRLGEQLAVIDLNGLKAQLEAQITRFGGQVERQLSLAIAPASDAIAQAVQALSDALDGFDPGDIVDALRGVLSAITGVLQSGEVADAIAAIRSSIDTLAETLERLSFAPVTEEVIALIDQMTKALKQVQQTDLNDAAKAALAIALQVLPEDLTPVTDPLLDDFDGLIESGPLPLLTRVADKPAELLGAITRFQPGALIGDQLGAPYRDALGRAEGFRPSALFAALDGELAKARGELVRQAAPSRALAPLQGPFDQLKGELRRYSPEALLAPLEQRIEDAIKEVVAASPVDEIFATVDRVFALIENALDVPRNLVATLTRIHTLLGHLADPDAQIDGWRDGLLDKVFGVTNLAAIGNALTDLNSALADTAHAALLARLDSQTQALRDALATYDPGRRVTALVSAHNRARRLVNALPDGAEKTAALAALDRFDPGRAAPLRLTRKLDEALGECRNALAGLAADWQELAESPQGVLAEIAAATADADGLRALVASAIEPPLAPLRHLFRLLASVQPAVAGMLATLTDLVDSLTTGVAALTTGPGSLQSISDAAQQVVDTLRNIDVGFLREGLQGLFIQLLDQLDALNPAQLGAALDAAFASVLEAIDLDSIIPAGTLTTLDASYDTTLDKLRALDPQALIVEVVQPEYDATVGPLVAAFDLSPVFDALIELLHGLREELGSELGRVNGAYQGLRAARPSLGSVNVSISF